MKHAVTSILIFTFIVLTAFFFTACASNSSQKGETNSSTQNTSEQTNILKESTSYPESVPNGQSSETPEESSSAAATQQTGTDGKAGNNIVVAYFSRAGENYNVGFIEKGNTQIIAEMISEKTGGTLFHIQTVTPYPEDYKECTDIAKKEQESNARPELLENVENMDNYDVIFLGYPNWWGDMPMAVYTFLESHDFSNKTIVPFCTHEGSGMSNTVQSISDTCPGAKVLKGLAIRGQTAQKSPEEANKSVTDWLRENGFVE